MHPVVWPFCVRYLAFFMSGIRPFNIRYPAYSYPVSGIFYVRYPAFLYPVSNFFISGFRHDIQFGIWAFYIRYQGICFRYPAFLCPVSNFFISGFRPFCVYIGLISNSVSGQTLGQISCQDLITSIRLCCISDSRISDILFD